MSVPSVSPPPAPAFAGLEGRVLSRLLQLPFVRYHRVQLGFVERPKQYRRFLADVLGARVAALPDPVGVFGVGVHTEMLLKALPALAERLHCFTDNNRTLWNHTRFGRLVLPPEAAVAACQSFVLSTAVFQRVLEGDLRRLGFTGPVVAVDDLVPASWFLGEDHE